MVSAGACRNILSSSSSSGAANILDVYAASPTAADATTLLGGGEWWTSAPTFAQRPLDAATMTSAIRYQVIRRYANVGTAETWRVVYTQFDGSTSANTVMSNIQTNAGNGVSGPSAGDKALYYGQQLTPMPGTSPGGAPFETFTVVRLGAFVIESTWNRKDGFPRIAQLGTIAQKLVARLRDATNGKLHGTPISANELAALPPLNGAMTLLGAVKLPVEAVALMVNAPAPTEVRQLFTGLGVKEFVFGDYVLDEDTHMEVQTAVFNFSSAADASSMFDVFRGTVAADSNGLAITYNSATGPGQYDIVFVSGTRMGLMICRSTAEDSNEAASRACEAPIEAVSAAWRVTLNG